MVPKYKIYLQDDTVNNAKKGMNVAACKIYMTKEKNTHFTIKSSGMTISMT